MLRKHVTTPFIYTRDIATAVNVVCCKDASGRNVLHVVATWADVPSTQPKERYCCLCHMNGAHRSFRIKLMCFIFIDIMCSNIVHVMEDCHWTHAL